MAGAKAKDHAHRYQLHYKDFEKILKQTNDIYHKFMIHLFQELVNGNSEVDTRQYVFGLCTLSPGPPSERLKFAFDLYNKDETSYFTKETMGSILLAALEAFKLSLAHNKNMKSKKLVMSDNEKQEVLSWVDAMF